MKFTITTTDGVEINGDSAEDQKFKIEENGVLTFLDKPEGDMRHAVSYSPSAWAKVSYVRKTGGGRGRAAFVP